MQDLTLVGLTEDKSKLVLVSDSGEEYTLAADARLRAALRGDQARLGQLEIKMDSALRPRDIQARIRAGDSPEAVADAAQTTIDRIMNYATPVLAERAHIADRALRASVRRRGGDGPGGILYDAVSERLRAKNVDPESVEWDSWRREDGRWTVVADYHVADRDRRAKFTFDVQGRYVVAEDDESRWLVGEPTMPKPQQPRGATSARRLSAVGFEQELPLGDDAIELVTGADDALSDDADESTVDLTQTARELRGKSGGGTTGGTTVRADELAAAGDADWMATQASERPLGRPRGREQGRDQGRPVREQEPQTEPVDRDEQPAKAGEADSAEAPGPAETSETTEPSEPATKKAGRKGRRASVPSWDEIMFGGGRSE